MIVSITWITGSLLLAAFILIAFRDQLAEEVRDTIKSLRIWREHRRAVLLLRKNAKPEPWDARGWSEGARVRFMLGIEKANSSRQDWPTIGELYASRKV